MRWKRYVSWLRDLFFLEHVSWDDHLEKAGVRSDVSTIRRGIFHSAVVISLLVSCYVIIRATEAGKGAADLLIFMAGYWTAMFLFILIVITLGYLIYLDLRKRWLYGRGITWSSLVSSDDESFSLEQFLQKAGLGHLDGYTVKKRLFQTAVYLSLAVSLYLLFQATQLQSSAYDLVVFMTGYWTAFFAFVLIAVYLLFTLYLDVKSYRRTKEVEEHLPHFLQLASANVSAGMPIDRALWFAVRPEFGILSEEIEDVAKSTYAGAELKEALTRFAEKFDSAILERAMNLIKEGMAAGGEMADLLNRIAMNIEETKILQQEMAANVTTYVIFIGVATILGAPFLFGLATQLLIVIQQIAGSIGIGGASGGMSSFSMSINPEAVNVGDFKLYCSAMLAVTSFFSAGIISVIRKGNVKEGAVLIPAFIAATQLLYRLANVLLGGLMSAFF